MLRRHICRLPAFLPHLPLPLSTRPVPSYPKPPYPRQPTQARLRRLATHRTVNPPPQAPPLKGDVTPSVETESLRPPPFNSDGKLLLKDMTLPELTHFLVNTHNEKPFRARQLYNWLYRPEKLAASFDDMTDLSKSFRALLKNIAVIDALTVENVHTSADGTMKIVYAMPGGGAIETVVIPTDGRTTICVSSQWGCALNCQFCQTGRTGFKRGLSQAEIVDQIILAKRMIETDRRAGFIGEICNIVFMGEGEPLHNVDNVIRAVEVFTKGMGFSHNKVTVSTSGLVPEIHRFVRESRANLAVSLHATDDELRSWLMPINRKYPLGELMGALRDIFPREDIRQQKVFFQYVMLKGVNDSLQDAKQLVRLVSRVPCKINLIEFNTHEGALFEKCDEETMKAFQDFLVKKGLIVTIRKSRGDDGMMACGQLGRLQGAAAPRLTVPEKWRDVVEGRVAKNASCG